MAGANMALGDVVVPFLTLNIASGILMPIVAEQNDNVGSPICIVTWLITALTIVYRARTYFSEKWPIIGFLAFAFHLATPGNSKLLPLTATTASIAPQAFVRVRQWTYDQHQKWLQNINRDLRNLSTSPESAAEEGRSSQETRARYDVVSVGESASASVMG
ncbi:hypothetical protein Q7P37_005501 [Cladosporium fusiforme]